MATGNGASQRPHLLTGNDQHKRFIYQRLKLLDEVFAIDLCGFSLMDNHMHLVLRLDPQEAQGWSDREVVERWAQIHPPRDGAWQVLEVSETWINQKLQEAQWVNQTRSKLADLSQFMKDLKQPIAQMANRQDQVSGHFWEGRFRSVALLDEEALLAASAYVDLNPFVAGKCELPEKADYTSLKERAQAYEAVMAASARAVETSSPVPAVAAEDAEAGIWFVPVEDRPGLGREKRPRRRGMLRGFLVGEYLQIVDAAARLIREGKARLAEHVVPILERLNLQADHFMQLLNRITQGLVRGCVLGARRRGAAMTLGASRAA